MIIEMISYMMSIYNNAPKKRSSPTSASLPTPFSSKTPLSQFPLSKVPPSPPLYHKSSSLPTPPLSQLFLTFLSLLPKYIDLIIYVTVLLLLVVFITETNLLFHCLSSSEYGVSGIKTIIFWCCKKTSLYTQGDWSFVGWLSGCYR